MHDRLRSDWPVTNRALPRGVPPGVLLLRLVLAMALDPAALYAQGGPPMLTDDPDTPGSGNWEINLAYIEERNKLERLRSVPACRCELRIGRANPAEVRDGVGVCRRGGWRVAKRFG